MQKSNIRDFSANITTFDGENLTATATANVPLAFSPLIGPSARRVSVLSSAGHALNYQDLLFAIDMSSSMGMGATELDRKKLGDLTVQYTRKAWYGNNLPQGCAFGCHAREGWEPGNKTVYQMARENGITLLEDELLHQFGGLVDLLLDPSDRNVAEHKRTVSVIGFSQTTKRLITASTSASAVKNSLDSFPADKRFETYFAKAFTEISNMLGVQGDGSRLKPKKMLILITDGIESRDAFYSQGPIDAKLCRDLKAKGFDIAVVELKYPKLLNNYLYDDTVLSVETKISPALQECASPDWYFQVKDNSEIPKKFQELGEKFDLSTVRLTQ